MAGAVEARVIDRNGQQFVVFPDGTEVPMASVQSAMTQQADYMPPPRADAAFTPTVPTTGSSYQFGDVGRDAGNEALQAAYAQLADAVNPQSRNLLDVATNYATGTAGGLLSGAIGLGQKAGGYAADVLGAGAEALGSDRWSRGGAAQAIYGDMGAGAQAAGLGTEANALGLLSELGAGKYARGAIADRLNQTGPVPTMYSNPIMRAADDVTGFRAYHGSPHDFGRFDFSKMGTGEGAQAYGKGGYFASEADVARSFRKGQENSTISGKPVNKIYDEISSRADKLPPKAAETEYNKMAVLEDLMNDGDILGVRERAAGGAYDPAAMDWFEKEVAPKFKGYGSLYEVNIKADPAEFLDWEKPLSEQPKKVRDALDPFIQERLNMLEAAGQRGREIALEKGLPDYTPRTREELFARLRGGDIAASGRMGQSSFSEEALQQAGVPGIKYLDPSARSTNYVVFDENLINIVKKYGIAGAATMLGVSAIDVEKALADNVPSSQWDQLVVGPQ